VLPEISNRTVSRRQPFVLMMQATDRQINPLRTNDIIEPAIDSFETRPMRISMRVVIAPTMVLTGWFAWVNPFQRFITDC
jgi:hypothetical protein